MYTKILLILLLTSIAFVKTNAQVPANDECTNATLITTTPFGTACSTSASASTLNATPSIPGTTCVATPDDDIWYRFTAASSSVIFRYANARNLVTGNQTSPSIALYQGNCPATATTFFCLAVTTSGSGFRIINGLTPGATYYLRLWSLSASIAMTLDFCIQDVPAPPSNDNCAGAQAIATLPPGSSCVSPINATTVGATMSVPAPFCSSSSHNDDVWFSFVANTSAVNVPFSNARLATSNSNANIGYALYADSCPGTNAALVCNGNLAGNSGMFTLSNLMPGHTYYLRFFAVGENNYMTFDFCVIDVILAPNDECASAIGFNTFPLGQPFTALRVSTANSTQSPNDPNCSSGENNDDIWYKFTATTATIVLNLKNVINNETGNGATAGYALYESLCPTSNATISCNTIGSAGGGEHIINGLRPGAEYYLRLWSTLAGGNTVSLDVYVFTVPPASNDNCANAIMIDVQREDDGCSGTVHASTAGATRSSPDPACTVFNDEDIWYSFRAPSSAVRLNFSNAVNTIGSGGAVVGYSLHALSCPVTATDIGCQENIGSGSGSVLLSGLSLGTTYYLRLFSLSTNNYIDFDFCLTDASLPPNDECSNAIEIMTGEGFCTRAQTGTFRNATASAGFSEPACAPAATIYDVWFKATIPTSGNLVIQTSPVYNQAIEDLVMEAYIGACNGLTRIACDDDGNPEPFPSSAHARISLTGQTPGEQVFLRVIKKFPNAYDQFAICAWDSTVILPVAQGGNCPAAPEISINADNGNTYMWVPVRNGANHIIAEINAGGGSLNDINTSVFVNTSGTVRNVNGHFYLDRNLSIVPESPGGARIRLYIKNSEFQALQAADPTIQGLQDLKINKTSAACGPVFTGPGTTILQDSSGNYGADHFVEFSIPSFSSFFVDGGESALPLEFLSFRAEKKNNHIALGWVVVQDGTIHKFEIQRSDNGISFTGIGEQTKNQHISVGNGSWQYHFNDNTPASGVVYYRIKMSDVNGKLVYSKVVVLNAGPAYTGTLSVYPNPVSKQLFIRMPTSVTSASLALYNSAGIVVKQLPRQLIANGVYTLDMQAQPSGIYILQVRDGREQFQFKVIKQ
jgi:hypothetical protein